MALLHICQSTFQKLKNTECAHLASTYIPFSVWDSEFSGPLTHGITQSVIALFYWYVHWSRVHCSLLLILSCGIKTQCCTVADGWLGCAQLLIVQCTVCTRCTVAGYRRQRGRSRRQCFSVSLSSSATSTSTSVAFPFLCNISVAVNSLSALVNRRLLNNCC